MCPGWFNFRSPKFDTSRLNHILSWHPRSNFFGLAILAPPSPHPESKSVPDSWGGANAPNGGQTGGSWDADVLAGLAGWLGSLAVQAGLSGRVVRLGCQAGLSKPACGCLAGWLAWPAGWPAWPGLPPCPPSPPDATTGATGLSELGRRLDRKEAPATPQKAAPKANNQSSLRPNSDKPVAPVVE